MKYEAGLTSFRKAVQLANPDLNNEEVDELIKEIKAEKLDRVSEVKDVFKNTKDENLDE